MQQVYLKLHKFCFSFKHISQFFLIKTNKQVNIKFKQNKIY